MLAQRFRPVPDSESHLNVIAVDLGYSATRKSCGFASSVDGTKADCTFGDCIRRIAEAIRSIKSASAVLVLEAVLSTRHDPATGNPIARTDLERGREWYRQPGVVTFASALRFLNQLNHLLPKEMPVYVAEAFLSNKATRTRHAEDADRIARQFWQVTPIELPSDLEAASPHVAGVAPIRVFK